LRLQAPMDYAGNVSGSPQAPLTGELGEPYQRLVCGLAGEVVRTFGGVRLRVFGTSMVPSVLPGDLISVQKTGLADISPGEIVLFSQQGRLFAHRVVRRVRSVVNPYLITRGDRLGQDDPPVSSSELLGRVSSIERGNRQPESPSQRNGRERVVARLLQTSDYATHLYLRVVRFWGKIRSNRLLNKRLISVIPNEARNLSSSRERIPRCSVPRFTENVLRERNDTPQKLEPSRRVSECRAY